MGLDYSINIVAKIYPTSGSSNEKETSTYETTIEIAYWRKHWHLCQQIINPYAMARALPNKPIDDVITYTSIAVLPSIRDMIAKELQTPDSPTFTDTVWGETIAYAQTCRNLGSINAAAAYFASEIGDETFMELLPDEEADKWRELIAVIHNDYPDGYVMHCDLEFVNSY